MSEETESQAALRYNLGYFWPKSFSRIEIQPDGKIWAFFNRYYKDGYHKSRARGVHYELKVVFHPHPYEAGVNYHFGKMSFGGARLPKQYKKQVVAQMKAVLKNHTWVEERILNKHE